MNKITNTTGNYIEFGSKSNGLTLKDQVINRWKQGQGIARIQREMMITINLFDKSLAKLNDAILKGRFEVLGMNGERPFKITNDDIAELKKEIADLKDKLSHRNLQIKELKNKVSEEANDLYNLMYTIREIDYAKQNGDIESYDYWNKRLGQIIHIKPYGKIKD